MSGSHLLSHAVARIVPSAVEVLTVVFGMGTGVSPSRIATRQFYQILHWKIIRMSGEEPVLQWTEELFSGGLNTECSRTP